MKKVARYIYVLVGSVFPIFIGALHMHAHYTFLVSPKVQNDLSDTILIYSDTVTYYNTWGLMSVMMGVSFIVIGLLNISIFSRSSKDDYPPVGALLAMVFYLCAVIYVGTVFGAANQFYGGIFGMTLTLICLFLSIRNSKP